MNIAAGETTELIWETDGAESVTINQEIGTVGVSGSIEVTPSVTTAYTLTAVNAGGSASVSATISVVPLRLVIEPPLDQVSTPAASIPVKGRVITTASYAQVAVNSQPALVNNKEFLLPEFSLESGQNSVTVHATDSNGNSTEAMLTVNRETTLNWLEIQMEKAGGFAPLATRLRIVPHLQAAVNWDTAILLDQGPGSVLVEGSAEQGYQLSFSEPGMYTLDLELRDEIGEVYTAQVYISVVEPLTAADWQAMNQGVQAVEDSFTVLLNTMDVLEARQQVLEEARANGDFSSATLSSGSLCLFFRGLIPVILDLPDPDAPPVD
ncbi:hypothetical protein [Desulfogranum mediterraneum]|uniref:hypothetical protein n=1 Tax=Desulfogranum mediterraneum TaxID=160661 RepID=UPI0012947623|nr:hypothetical protein [Desulfogranum mediterraneum]